MIITILLLLFSFQNFEYAPIGTIKVGNYWVDKDEASNIHWLEYLYYKELELDSISLDRLKPDESNDWYKNIENRYKPITYLSYDQVTDYCKWRSEVVSKSSKQNITYRLMTPKEWIEIAKILVKEDEPGIRKLILKTQRKSSHRKYHLELYQNESTQVSNFFTNVSEMTSTRGISMGGNNGNLIELEKQLSETQPYTKPAKYLGFRCIAIIE